jgi:outer membrane protein OmpA-like peptidoglycan-associated protein
MGAHRHCGLAAGVMTLLLAPIVPGLWLPAAAQDAPSLKELLGRAQSGAEKKAVEDLIGKLQGRPAEQPVQPEPKSQPKSEPAQAPADKPASPVAGETKPAAVETSPQQQTPPIEVAKPQDGVQPRQEEASPEKAAAATPAPADQKGASADSSRKTEQAASSAPLPKPSADTAVRRADSQQLPSVDLEIFFDYNSAEITGPAVAKLATLGQALTDPRLAGGKFLIAGHTDAKGGSGYNLRLSTSRARAVRRFLIANFHLDPDRLTAQGFGSRHLKNAQQPLASENRRVQIVNVTAPSR